MSKWELSREIYTSSMFMAGVDFIDLKVFSFFRYHWGWMLGILFNWSEQHRENNLWFVEEGKRFNKTFEVELCGQKMSLKYEIENIELANKMWKN